MLIKKNREIHVVQAGEFDTMCGELLGLLPVGAVIASLVFYGNPRDAAEYAAQLRLLDEKCRAVYGIQAPPMAYIAQKPLEGGLMLEACLIENAPGQVVDFQTFSGIRYVTIQNGSCKELIIGGAMPGKGIAGTYDQATDVFARIGVIFRKEHMPVDSIVRQWNYIGNITGTLGGKQNYHEFNRARSDFYGTAGWENGYPAATGISIRGGALVIRLEAMMCSDSSVKSTAINNELQVPAHRYSQQVIIGSDSGAGTPKFERARMITSKEHSFAYISGTAAIRGEQSMAAGDAVEQTRITMENICHLIPCGTGHQLGPLIIYLKKEEDYLAVKHFMDQHFPLAFPAYLVADICREELLVEIEAVVRFT